MMSTITRHGFFFPSSSHFLPFALVCDVDFESCEIISSIYTTMSTQTFPPMHSSLAWHTRKEWQTSCHEISLLFSSRVEELERRNYTQLSSTPFATIQLEASSISPLRRRARERGFHNEQRTWINKIKNSISTKFAFSIFTFIHFVRVRLPDMRVGLSGWLEISAILHFVYLLCTGFSLSLSVVCCVRTKHFIPHDALLLSHWIIMQKYLISSSSSSSNWNDPGITMKCVRKSARFTPHRFICESQAWLNMKKVNYEWIRLVNMSAIPKCN